MAIAMFVSLPELNLQFGQVFFGESFGDSQSQICLEPYPLLPLQGCCFLFRGQFGKTLGDENNRHRDFCM